MPAKLVLHMLKDKELRGKLQALGLPTDGHRKVCVGYRKIITQADNAFIRYAAILIPLKSAPDERLIALIRLKLHLHIMQTQDLEERYSSYRRFIQSKLDEGSLRSQGELRMEFLRQVLCCVCVFNALLLEGSTHSSKSTRTLLTFVLTHSHTHILMHTQAAEASVPCPAECCCPCSQHPHFVS